MIKVLRRLLGMKSPDEVREEVEQTETVKEARKTLNRFYDSVGRAEEAVTTQYVGPNRRKR